MRYSFVLICLLLLSAICTSQTVGLAGSGNAFLRYCEGSNEPESHGMCRGYVMGVYDGIQMVPSPFSDQICDPEHVTADQIYRIAVKYMQGHPEETHKFTSVLIFEASRGAFPCPVKK